MTKIYNFFIYILLNSMTEMCNISHVFLDYMDTFLQTIHHILVVSMIKTLVLDFTMIVISWVT